MSRQTMGVRIAERRKLLGLSQEALGEKLGVSRQAISKWEADGAVPEIDKLIAMSRLFEVTVGWLLGTEGESASDGLSDTQLQLMEELVKKYSQSQPRESRINLVWMILIAVLVGIAMLLAGNAASRAGALQEQLSMQTSMLFVRYHAISDQLYQLERGLDFVAESDRLLTEYALEVQPMENTTDVQLLLTAVPGTWAQGDRAWLSLRKDSQEITRGECSFDGNALVARFPIPMEKSYVPYLIILRSDGAQQQQVLRKTVLEDLRSYANFQITYGCDYLTYGKDDARIVELELHLRPPERCPEDASWQQAQVLLCVNGEPRQTYGLLPQEDGVADPFRVEQVDATHFRVSAPGFHLDSQALGLKTGDVVTLELQGSLTSGHSFRQTLWSFRRTEAFLSNMD